MGGCSSKVLGPGGPSQVRNFEYQWVKPLNNKEIAILDQEYAKEVSAEKSLLSGQRLLLSNKNSKKIDGNNLITGN
jgi:hypothetical protein